ncbi:MAG TPA: hypothetical protein VFT22_12610 [Kofleriaceae bacterium]|nr:hypothetical protein [Kofleriaceae bacterium]
MRVIAWFVVVLASSPALAAPALAAPPLAAPPLAAPIERRLHPDSVDASSFLWNDWNKFVENYHPNYVADDDPATAWVEGAKGSGAGEWLRIQTTLLERTTRVRLRVRNGYQKSKDLFKANARARDVTVRLLPSKIERRVTLADRNGWQDVVIDQPSGPVRAVELVVGSVYEGARYEDLCISDVQVFATSLTPDNPAFEKSKHQALMAWRASRLAAARRFKAQSLQLPLYPAYEVTASDADAPGAADLDEMLDLAIADRAFASEWKTALAVAKQVSGELDKLPRAQVAPASADALVEADGLQISRMHNLVGEGDGPGFYDETALRLPMLDYVATLFADRLRVLDVKDPTTIHAFLASNARCKADVTWVSREAPREQSEQAVVRAIVVGRCARIPTRDGSFNARAIELYVYDRSGRLALSVANGHIDGYRWVNDQGRQMLAGGRALLAQGKAIEARRREAAVAK